MDNIQNEVGGEIDSAAYKSKLHLLKSKLTVVEVKQEMKEQEFVSQAAMSTSAEGIGVKQDIVKRLNP